MIHKHFKSKIVNFCITFFIIFISESCQKDTAPYVPDVPVYYELSFSSELANLGVSQFVTITADTINTDYSIVDYHNKNLGKFRIAFKTYGNGIILYCKDVSEYQAFDLTCTYRGIEDHCALKVGGLQATCPCCNSTFLLSFNGYPSNGSLATKPLWMYTCSVAADGLHLIVSK